MNITILGYILKLLSLILFFNFISEVSKYASSPTKENNKRVSFWGKVSIAFTILVISCQILESSIVFNSETYVDILEFLPLFIELFILVLSFIMIQKKSLNFFSVETEDQFGETSHQDYVFSNKNDKKRKENSEFGIKK